MGHFFFSNILFVTYLFIFWLCWGFRATGRLSLNVASKGYSLVAVKGLLIAVASAIAGHGLQVRGLHELQPVGFRSCGSRALQRWLNSCDASAQLLSCMWVIPGLEVKPVSPALQGGVPTTGPEGKPPVG